jgi:tetratricopeptide (TPR) repeat protein
VNACERQSSNDEWRRRDARALTEYLRPTDDDAAQVDGPRYRFSNVGQKYGLLVRVLERLGRRRPVMLWLDDLQWGSEAVGLLEHLEARADDLPVLVVATVRDDVVAEKSRLEDRFVDLAGARFASHFEVSPLDRTHQRELLTGLLPLEETLADRLAERTEGHPMFAMQLLGDWIDRDAIEVGPAGFRVADGHDPELPDDIHQLWRRRLGRLVQGLSVASPEPVERAVEMAAALGREVDGDEWRAVCAEYEVGRSDIILDRLVERGLAEHTDRGWAFAHGMFVESLERRAREAGRWRDHHRRCADLIEDLYPNRPRQMAGRRADHLVEAGELERALEPLELEIRRLRRSDAFERIRKVLRRRRRILDNLEITDEDPRRLDNRLKRIDVEFMLGESPDSVLTSIESVCRRAHQLGHDWILAEALTVEVRCQQSMGKLEQAREAAQRAVDMAGRCGRNNVFVSALSALGKVAYARGDLEGAERRFSEAHARAVEAESRYKELSSRWSIAVVAIARGEDEEARDIFESFLEESREGGFRSMELSALSALGEIARFAGNAEEARRWYRRCGRLAREASLPKSLASQSTNLAQVELLDGRVEAAGRHLREAERRYEELARTGEARHLLRLIRLGVAAGTGDWARFDEACAPYSDGWPEGAKLIKDHPWLLEISGDYAAEAGERERAERVWELAGELWGRLENEEESGRVASKIEGIEGSA